MEPRRVAAGAAVVALAVFAGVAKASIPNPDFALAVDVAQEGRILTYTIHFDNVGAAPSARVVLTDALPAGATYLGNASDVSAGTWTQTYEGVSTGSHAATLAILVAATVADGDHVVNVVALRYLDASGTWNAKSYATDFSLDLRAPPAPSAPIPTWWAAPPVAALALGAIAIARPRRRAKIEQVFLMHSSGMLIHHWAADVAPSRDIDILSGMIVILREFVRDSWREKEGGLSELQFGDSRMFLAEGRHALLAAVASGPCAGGLPAQLASAVSDFERLHGSALDRWDGRPDRIAGARTVVDGLVHGRYRNWRMT